MFQHATRMFHTTRIAFANVEKGALAALRKKTGYTFINCKKALELHKNDVNLAEKWLHEQAQSMGWSKATKLEGRATAQGLVGVITRGNIGAMVEVNCETDFVARNDNFKDFVNHTARVCAKYTAMTDFDGDLCRLGFEGGALKNLKSNLNDGKTLGDHLALLIGIVGENVSFKRAICFRSSNELRITGFVHPTPATTKPIQNTTQMGKYGTIVAIRGRLIDEELQKNICQHIIGLSPKKIGEFGKDEPMANKDDETCLIHQEYLIDPEKTFGDVLKENDLAIEDFQRYECGEVMKNDILEEAKLSN